jgi:thiol-disulfide isomerase/thioredoxin
MLTFLLLLTLASSLPMKATGDETSFAKPSEAYKFAHQPLTEWESALRAGKEPLTKIAPRDEVHERAKRLCSAFDVSGRLGEELYSLALLCKDARDWQQTKRSVERYLGGPVQEHGPEARLLLVDCQLADSRLDQAWRTLRLVLQKDPIGSDQELKMRIVIDSESDTDYEKALEWSKERYSIMMSRTQVQTPGQWPVSIQYLQMAGSDLVHRYYLAGQTDRAKEVLAELNRTQNEHPDVTQGWGTDQLRWANLEMQPAPPIPVLKLFGSESGAELIRRGRVEVISFFFVGCAPCMSELPDLNALQKRYGGKILVADVTSYEANSRSTFSTQPEIEAVVSKLRLQSAPDVVMVITTKETLESFGVHGFPTVALIDKEGRVRSVSFDKDFGNEEPLGRLIRKLVEEEVHPSHVTRIS